MKGDKLFEDAIFDFENKRYNKAVSSFYFAVRWYAELLLKKLRSPIPRRDDKLANAIENLGLIDVARTLRLTYNLRLKADYSDFNITFEEANQVKSIVENAISKLRSHLFRKNK
ncbi:MAG: HEPN domain-containing protein [Candidatus Odinarchaeota archaeon]|nr:HEPN domain-containing protein [Candidatus Odinarchaeota archaeon]